jgi:serine/threonine protein phosphatase PrpC
LLIPPFEPENKSRAHLVSRECHDTLSSSIVAAVMTNAYLNTNNALNENEDIDAKSSGTTATSLFVTKNGLHVANVGDSRCLLVSYPKKNGPPEYSVLTNDHSPDREDEQERIKAHGGVIMPSDQYDVDDDQVFSFEPIRVWSEEGKWPGTAFTRSIGDIKAKELGVCADPECSMVPMPDNDSILYWAVTESLIFERRDLHYCELLSRSR